MQPETLASFVETALRERRIRFGDVRRLERHFSPDGLSGREEAETLLALDRTVAHADPAWTAFLVGAVRILVVRGLPPVGIVDTEKAEWLLAVAGAPPSKTAVAIAREIAVEALYADPIIGELAKGRAREKRVPAQPVETVDENIES